MRNLAAFGLCLLLMLCAIWSPPLFGSSAAHAQTPPASDFAHGPLTPTADGRFLTHADGTPFFYLGDTNWELFMRARREDAQRLIQTRRAQGFTVLTAPVTGILDAIRFEQPLRIENAQGDLPFNDADVLRPATTEGADPSDAGEYDYWDHVDYIIELARQNGLYVALIPAWRPHYELGLVNEENARAYGRFLGQRLGGHDNVIWVLGGDANVDGAVTARLMRELAAGIEQGDAGQHLMSYHPETGASSADWFHDDAWIDFHMIQSGHRAANQPNYEAIAEVYERSPPKPVLDGESRYEDHAIAHNPDLGWFDDADVRQSAYWALFAGAHGHVYGNRGVWQMYEPGREGHRPLRYYWYDAMTLPGAQQMRHVRDLMLSRPFLSRRPNQALLVNSLSGASRLIATQGDGYAFVYTPQGRDAEVHLNELSARQIAAWWFDPRTGQSARIGVFPAAQAMRFNPPGAPARGNDWILVLDDAARNFPAPGAGRSLPNLDALTPGRAARRAEATTPQERVAIATRVAAIGGLAGLVAAFAQWRVMRRSKLSAQA